MSKIKIIKTPPGFAPEPIRDQWVGVEISLPTAEQIAEDSPSGVSIGNENANGYHVLTSDALKALEDANQLEAYAFWQQVRIGKYLRFHRDVCEEIQ